MRFLIVLTATYLIAGCSFTSKEIRENIALRFDGVTIDCVYKEMDRENKLGMPSIPNAKVPTISIRHWFDPSRMGLMDFDDKGGTFHISPNVIFASMYEVDIRELMKRCQK